MNLTSKRLLQFFAGCVGVCAFTAAAGTQYLVDTFDEASVISWQGGSGGVIAASNGMDIAHYKSTLNYGDNSFYTNSWFAATGDASALTNVTVSFTGDRPLTDPIGAKVLNLETEGQTLTRALDVVQDISSKDIYVDTLIKFTPSEDAPTIASDVKAAVYVNVSSNLVIWHGSESSGNSATDVGITVDPNQWYRLTICLGVIGESALTGFKVYVNGSVITSSQAVDDNFDAGGSWFYNAQSPTAKYLNSVAFQGTGMIDELVVTDTANGITSTAILLTLVFDSKITVYNNTASAAVANGGTVTAGDQITVTSADWYEITDISGTGVTYGKTSPSRALGVGQLVQETVGTVSAAAAADVNITDAQFSTQIPTGLEGPYATVDGAKLSAWAIANSKSQSQVTAAGVDWLDDYLMNVAPDTNAKPTITSIVVDGGVATITVSATNTEAVDLTNLNGTLKVYTADSLGGTFAEAASYSLDSETATIATFTVNMGTAKFIKAVVE